MNFFTLLEAVKKATPEEKEEILDRYYKNERIIVKAMLETKYGSHDERR